MHLQRITIQRYRSINNLTVNILPGKPLVICGSNNVGKTNFLRAMDLFFSLEKNKFNKENDIPYDITAGRSTGGRYKTTFRSVFVDEKNKYEIKVDFQWKKDVGNTVIINGRKNKVKIPEAESKKIVRDFRFVLVEASNIEMPKIIDEIVDGEILPLSLDGLRVRQRKPLQIFRRFIKESEKSVAKIEEEIGAILNDFIVNIPGIDTKGWRIEILFAEYKKLREAISGLINFTLYDKNKKRMEQKGSGIQRIIFLSLIKYIADFSKKKIIWGIDEPEAFLQPALQKRVFDILWGIAEKQSIFYTTHSAHFVDMNQLDNACLFEAEYSEREFAKKAGEVFYKVNTFVCEKDGAFEKARKIREHLGISRNDGWEVMPYNLLVEGEEDKYYLSTLIKKFGLEVPNILIAGGTDKIKGYLQFLNEFCEDLRFKPIVRCVVDHDDAGKKVLNQLTKKNFSAFDLKVEFIPRMDGYKALDFDYEIEDFVYPDILLQACNSFLQKKGYKKVPRAFLNGRTKGAYDKKCILSSLSEICRSSNVEKLALDMENDGIKKALCEKTLQIIKRMDLSFLDQKFPEARKFLTSIASPE